MAARVKNAVSLQPFDAVIASITKVAPYALDVPGAARLLEEHNFLTAWMEERYRAQRSPLRKTAYWVSWLKNRHYERMLFPKFETITMVSERDLSSVRENISHYRGRLEMIPNGVDVDHNRPLPGEPEPDTLVFNGSLTYNANLDAMRYFLSEIFPRIRARRPQVRLKITGRTEGADLNGIAGQAGVILTGFLEDIRPSVSGSYVCVVPLRIGGGTRLKILEAMALGTPVVSTSKGAEGLCVTPGKELMIANDPQAFADQTLRLLDESALRRRLARDARALVEASYSWEGISEQFCEVVEKTVETKLSY
jgi:glycosyltransferase involved in cell wall biosynthesis